MITPLVNIGLYIEKKKGSIDPKDSHGGRDPPTKGNKTVALGDSSSRGRHFVFNSLFETEHSFGTITKKTKDKRPILGRDRRNGARP